MRRPRLRLVLGLTIPLLVVITLLAAWAIDSSSANGKVPRNVTLAGRDISKLPEDELAATVADIAKTYADTQVEVRTPGQTYKVAASKLGLRLNENATIQAALDLDQDEALRARPLLWLSSFLDQRKSPLRFTVDADALDQGLAGLTGNEAASEPSIVLTGTGFGIISGSRGRRVTGTNLRGQLLARARSGEKPIVLEATAEDRPPEVTDAEAKTVADKLTVTTARGLTVKAGDRMTQISTSALRSWVGAKAEDGTVEISIDAKKATADLVKALPEVVQAKEASIALFGGAVRIDPSVQGEKCCASDTAGRLLAAVKAGASTADVDLDIDKPAFTTADAYKLGIVEPVGGLTEWQGKPQVRSFTTYYPANEPRVINIHRIADLVRGKIVKPGETFSLNGTVGERTELGGFVKAEAIAEGEHVDEVGGGVSQFATTMFNAAFFAGLPIPTSQAHSEYFDRYPYGREATVGFPDPDLKWKNDTPYGILIDTSYTDTSVTVTLWSTQFAFGEQTGQSKGRSGRCATVTTERTIHFPFDKIRTDTFNARYRPAGSTTC